MPNRALHSNTPDELAFLDAARAGDSAAVMSFLAKGLDPNTPDLRDGPWNVTPLMHAAIGGHDEVIRALLKSKARVSAATRNVGDERRGETALHYAAAGGHPPTARLLLDAKANINKLSPSSGTPLAVAVEERKPEMVGFLLEKGADPNLAGSFTGWTPLHIAVNNVDLQLVRLLIAKGADVNARDAAGWTPFMKSTSEPDPPGLLVNLPSRTNPEEPGFSFYAMAGEVHGRMQKHLKSGVRGPDPAIPRFLIANGADLTAADRSGFTCLMWAVVSRAPWLVTEVLNRGVDPNAMDSEGATALDIAVRDGLLKIQQILRHAGAKPAAELRPRIKTTRRGRD